MASFYGSDGEKGLNEHVAMLSSEVCPKCLGAPKWKDVCDRCHGDGYLTNQIKFNPESMECASNIFKLGTRLLITPIYHSPINCWDGKCELNKYCIDSNRNMDCPFIDSIIVMVTDRVPGAEGRHDWIDLTRGSFMKLAPLELGIIDVEVEVIA
jgi:hypothetical protein